MNKTELINQISESADISKEAAANALAGFMTAVTDTMKKGDKLSLIGFGTFSVTQRAARTCCSKKSGQVQGREQTG